ncbi:hypothetical protein [Kocuria sp.]|uniref:hypothetical protein n=1 Tax=Kocuria sp. TaxID=1871328 RepID=UPI0026DFB108|nr:hypothetical protein [Kocuria sp.]MDO5617805.1 hypothetical protein [Kocuria sp.]
MKIEFIGNSHLGTIAPAITTYQREIDHDVEYYISRTYGSVPLGVVGDSAGAVLPSIKLESEARFGHVADLRQADVLALVGLRFSAVQMVDLWKHYHPVGAQGSYASPTVGPSIWDAYVDAAFDDTEAVRIIKALPASQRTRVVLIPQPAPAAWVAEVGDPRFRLYHRLVKTGDWDRVRTDYQRQLTRLSEFDVEVYEQPQSTITDQGFTRSELAMGNPADTSESSFYTRGDFYHMNKEFSQRLVPDFFKWIESTIKDG